MSWNRWKQASYTRFSVMEMLGPEDRNGDVYQRHVLRDDNDVSNSGRVYGENYFIGGYIGCEYR